MTGVVACLSVCTVKMAFNFQNQLRCSMCQDVVTDPVTFPCGHSYCTGCFTDYCSDVTGGFSCTQCQHTSGPAFGNTAFNEVLDGLQTLNLQTASLVHSNTGAEDVECDICTGRRNIAVKSCLECLKSYCQNHLQQHDMFFRPNRHNLINPTRGLNEMICPRHRKYLEIYCRTDQRCICCLCLTEEHTNHEIVAAEVERNDKQVRNTIYQTGKCQYLMLTMMLKYNCISFIKVTKSYRVGKM